MDPEDAGTKRDDGEDARMEKGMADEEKRPWIVTVAPGSFLFFSLGCIEK